jgi:hypothetical protein
VSRFGHFLQSSSGRVAIKLPAKILKAPVCARPKGQRVQYRRRRDNIIDCTAGELNFINSQLDAR